MNRYREHSQYNKFKKQAEQVYRKLVRLTLEDDEQAIVNYYKYLQKTKLYKEAGGLYCQILCDVAEATK